MPEAAGVLAGPEEEKEDEEEEKEEEGARRSRDLGLCNDPPRPRARSKLLSGTAFRFLLGQGDNSSKKK